jgi:uncharacterized membrane protein
VPLLAVCGRRFIGAWPAVFAAGLLAVNPWHVFWSQNARGYVLAVLATVIAVNRAHQWLRSDQPRDLIAAALAIALGSLSHPTAGLMVVGFVGFLFVRKSRHAPSWRKVAVFAAGLLVVMYGLPWLVERFAPFQDFIRSKADPSLLHFGQTVAYYFRPTVLLLAAVGLCLAPRAIGNERALLLGALVVVPLLALVAVGGQTFKVTARYAICILPVLTWLMALACCEIGRLLAARSTGPRTARVVLQAVLPVIVIGEYVLLTRRTLVRSTASGRGGARRAGSCASAPTAGACGW